VPRFWNAFGTELKETGSQSIVVEVNPPLRRLDGRASGLFAKNSAGFTYLLHRGRVGGGAKGVGKNAFLN
jgi:hypothetical protein